jgi:hypothetical protein
VRERLARCGHPGMRRDVRYGSKADVMSALPPKADIAERDRNVRFVPKADKVRCSKNPAYSITASAVANKELGIVRPSAGE